jgi:hypothetical protein
MVGSRHSLQSRAVWDVQAAAIQEFDGQANELVSGLQSSGGAQATDRTGVPDRTSKVDRTSTIPVLA